MRSAAAQMIPNTQRYVSPKECAENRARWPQFAYWVVVAIPATFALMMFGYSDQAPRWLREVTGGVDASFGFPVLWLIKAIAAR
jgi:hypothetical protein